MQKIFVFLRRICLKRRQVHTPVFLFFCFTMGCGLLSSCLKTFHPLYENDSSTPRYA